MYSVGAKIKSNTVSGSLVGLDYGDIMNEGANEDGYNTGGLIESNHFNGNVGGIIVTNNSSGSKFESNYTNGNTELGIASDATTGADAIPDAGTNRFEKNTAKGNGVYNYYDLTLGYAGYDPNVNDGTANYYYKNIGNTASPAAIVTE